MKIKVGVIFGGQTVEHEVSIISAVQAMHSFNLNKYEVIPIYISKDKEMYTGKQLKNIESYQDLKKLKKKIKPIIFYKHKDNFIICSNHHFKRKISKIDIAFPIVHGNNVEDGTIQGYLETIGVPYVGSGVIASAMGQDKVFMKQVFAANDLPIVDYLWFYDTEYLQNKEELINKIIKFKLPVIIKPATLGSSIGISKVHNKKELIDAIETAIKYDNKIVVEAIINNLVEVNCSVIGTYEEQEASILEEVMSTDEFLTYKDKYLGNSKGSKSKGMASTNRIVPARIDEKMSDEIKGIAKEVFRILNLKGICRIDFLIDKKKEKVYINEPNTIPGSLAYYLWEASDKTYPNLLDELIMTAIKSYQKRTNTISSFDNNLLENYHHKQGLKGKIK
ncbi:MAG: D-alanine--D-alanine ligase [Bacilli bacterium]|nr:D-alanine--D-alanine ligase [Bacilli bacterium]